jgi:short chain dehydrogenase
MIKLKNKWALVTGASRGVGMRVAKALADEGCRMLVHARTLDRYVRDMIPTLKGSDVLMNLLDPGWLRTDLGGSAAPNDPDTVLPGALVPVLLDKEAGSGRLYAAQDYRD